MGKDTANYATLATTKGGLGGNICKLGFDNFDGEPMSWIKRGTHDAEAFGSSKVPVINISFNEE